MKIKYSLCGNVNARGSVPAICVPYFTSHHNNHIFRQFIGIDHDVLETILVEMDGDLSSKYLPVEELDIELGSDALYWISFDDSKSGALVGRHSKIRQELSKKENRDIISELANPFERLDFAQLSEDYEWFAEEAHACQRVLFDGDVDRRKEWLTQAVLKGRLRYALESISMRIGIRLSDRRRLLSRLVLQGEGGKISIDRAQLCPADKPILSSAGIDMLEFYFENDFVCQYVRRQLMDVALPTPDPIRAIDSRLVYAVAPSAPAQNGMAWWRSAMELDADQTKAYQWPLIGSYLLRGPPGSGKTNILILRASYVASTGMRNVRLITYTRVLREFIASGCGDYINFPADQVMTVAGWINEFLDEQGFTRPDTKGLDENEAWEVRMAALREAAQGIQNYYDALIVDEVQDLPGELINIMYDLTSRLFMAGDSKQRIFQKDTKDKGMRVASDIADEILNLRYHYRVGQNICGSADRILTESEPLTATCRYNSPLGSRSEAHHIVGIEAQCAELSARLTTQIRAYPGEAIGVICGRSAVCDQVYEYLRGGPLGTLTKVMSSSSDEPWYDAERPICVMTLQAAKGSEFRAVHWVAADETPYFTRQKAYVVVTRAKSALDVYHSGALPTALQSAFATLQSPKPPF